MSYLCLTGTWPCISAENRLKDGFLLNFYCLGSAARFLAELFTTAMLFKWKGERTKSHEK